MGRIGGPLDGAGDRLGPPMSGDGSICCGGGAATGRNSDVNSPGLSAAGGGDAFAAAGGVAGLVGGGVGFVGGGVGGEAGGDAAGFAAVGPPTGEDAVLGTLGGALGAAASIP